MWNELFNQHKGKWIGAVSGVALGFIYLIWGFWDMLIFAFIVYIGYYIGKRSDHKASFTEWDYLWHWFNKRWRMFR